MAKSRVETFREYRRSIISEDASLLKAPIDTSLETSPSSDSSLPTENEILLLKDIKKKKLIERLLFMVPCLAITILLIVFGIKLF